MLFRHGTESARHATTRPKASDEAQLKELRAKARRRLVGALALVLAAVIIVPWLFEEPVSDDTHAPVVIPAVPSGLPATPPAITAAGSSASPDSSGTAAAAADSQGTQAAAPVPQAADSPAAGTTSGGEVTSQVAQADEPPAAAPKPPVRPATPEPKPAETSRQAPRPVERTDDGSVALALLAGKTPPAPEAAKRSSTAQGRYVLQVAAYATEQDALTRRDSLRQAGVTDAYVEQGQSSGRTVYRLRVGPFGSHEAAQAAQARLRALGYQNGLISGN